MAAYSTPRTPADTIERVDPPPSGPRPGGTMTTIQIPRPTATEPVVYPDSDGKPMADNTLQFEWIVTIKEGTEALFANSPDVFVAGDLLWYPVEGAPNISAAPDTLVAFGRPKGQ